jgi:hypothetical protein
MMDDQESKNNPLEDRKIYKLNFPSPPTAVETHIVVVRFMIPCSLVVNANFSEGHILAYLKFSSTLSLEAVLVQNVIALCDLESVSQRF